MSIFSRIGATIVIFALAFYSIAIISEQIKKKVIKRVLIFLTMGVVFDITATVFMIIGSSKGAFTVHGFLGYSSLTLMLLDTILIWKLKLKSGIDVEVPKSLHYYSLIAYLWWVLAFITGGLLVALR
jgi:hypothetical protein